MNKNKVIKFLPIIIILIGMVSIYFSGVYHYLSLDYLRLYHKSLKNFVQMHPITVPIAFCLVYTISTALSVPGAVFLTLLGGYLFPQPLSTIFVIFSATCGAVLIFLAARTAFKEVLKKKAAPFLEKMEKGFQENAVSYLLFLRFVPLFPFWLVNIAPAFFGVSLFTFIWTTLVGIFPGTLVFTLAGGGLDKILENNEPFSISTIFNIQIRIALILLGMTALAPMIWKKIKKNSRK
jgi:uncharacterized membrane protein YdjX (TVP38/TMEM64 family)